MVLIWDVGKKKDSLSFLNIYAVSTYTHCCVTYKAAGYRTIDLLGSAGLYGKTRMQSVQPATIQLHQARYKSLIHLTGYLTMHPLHKH